MTTAANEGLLDEAVKITQAAGKLTLRWFQRRGLVVDRKGDGTPVTEADRAAERFLRDHLARHHPDDAVVGEEEGVTSGTTRMRWYIDPIDGTRAFCHGVPLYATLLAVEDEHGPLIGVIDLPALGETVYAGRRLGCWHNGERARVNDHATLDGAYLLTSGIGHWPDRVIDSLQAAGVTVRTWGDAYGYALVATGRAEAMVDPEILVWDVAPMPVIMTEAGGRFSDFAGNPRVDTGTAVASNGRLHDDIVSLLARRD